MKTLKIKMNIFLLDADKQKCVEYYVNAHVIKMCLEHCQILCSVFHLQDITAPYKLTHKNHPCNIWARASKENFEYLIALTEEIFKEYSFRYKKVQKSEQVLNWVKQNKHLLKFNSNAQSTSFPQALPEDLKIFPATLENTIQAYRNYYLRDKQHLFKFKERNTPYWIQENSNII